MSVLNSLVGEEVVVRMFLDENDSADIKCKIISIDVNVFYFYEKGEPVYVTASVMPIEDFEHDISYEEFSEVPLDNIRKA